MASISCEIRSLHSSLSLFNVQNRNRLVYSYYLEVILRYATVDFCVSAVHVIAILQWFRECQCVSGYIYVYTYIAKAMSEKV